MGQKGFTVVEPGTHVIAGSVIKQVQQRLFVCGTRQEAVRAGIILPKGSQIADLPAFNGFGVLFVASVRSELVLDGPAADTGAVGLEIEAAMEFAGSGAVGGWRLGGEQFGQQGGDSRRPDGSMIAAGDAW